MTVLAVKDDAQRRRMSARLDNLGFFVIAAPDARQCLEIINRNVPRALVLDPDLPDMESAEVCRRARAMLGDRTPVIVYAGNCSVDDFEGWLDAGADDFVVRAGSVQSLVDRVAGRS